MLGAGCGLKSILLTVRQKDANFTLIMTDIYNHMTLLQYLDLDDALSLCFFSITSMQEMGCMCTSAIQKTRSHLYFSTMSAHVIEEFPEIFASTSDTKIVAACLSYIWMI